MSPLPGGSRQGTVAVVGGGIAGLAAAHRLSELGIDTVLFEREPRCGGVVHTEWIDGFLVEAGPDSFLARKPWAIALCERLGLGDDLQSTDSVSRGAFVWAGGRLHPLPEGLTALVPTRLGPLIRTRLLSPAGKARLLLEPILPRGPAREDESLAGFFRRRLGTQASRRLVEPLIRGIYGGDADSLSLQAAFPELQQLEQRYGSLVRGFLKQSGKRAAQGSGGQPRVLSQARSAAGFLTLRHGMGSLVDRLTHALPAGAVRTGTGVEGLQRGDDGGWEVFTASGERVSFAALVIAVPPAEAGRLLKPVDPRVGELVGGITAGSSLTVTLGFKRDDVRHPLRGHGFVVSEDSGLPLIACTWASSKFFGRAPAGSVLVRAFLAEPAALMVREDADLTELALTALRPILGMEGSPRIARVHRWRDALPRYAVGHPARVAAIEARLETLTGVFLAGAAYRGIGVPDCVREGEKAAESIGAQMSRSGGKMTRGHAEMGR